MQNKFLEYLEDMEVYINIKNSRIPRVAYRFLVMPCAEVIKWILLNMENNNLVLRSESGNEIATDHLHDIHSYYKMVKPRDYVKT